MVVPLPKWARTRVDNIKFLTYLYSLPHSLPLCIGCCHWICVAICSDTSTPYIGGGSEWTGGPSPTHYCGPPKIVLFFSTLMFAAHPPNPGHLPPPMLYSTMIEFSFQKYKYWSRIRNSKSHGFSLKRSHFLETTVKKDAITTLGLLLRE